ncbi:MAG TPA: MarR family transcriptional regulator [Polyangiaceae bacterium]|nr:MarR family transcriptional regulator [Polyangiaceae bacterium]
MTTPQSSEPRIAYLVKQVERGLRARLDKVLAPLGVTTPEYTALSILGARDGLSSAQLARRVFVTPQAMNQIVLELEGRGLIRRKVSESHSRVMCISLTPKGAALLARCDRASLPIEERLLSSLSTADALVLRRVLTSCAHALADTAPAEDAGTAGANGRSRPRAAAGARLRSE